MHELLFYGMMLAMDTVTVIPAGSIGREFIPAEFLSRDQDQFTIRNEQFKHASRSWRTLTEKEIWRLEDNGNRAQNWEDVLVSDPFDPDLVRDSLFFGLVRLGAIDSRVLQHHDLRVPIGITKSQIISSDIGDLCAVHSVAYLAHYIIGDRAIVVNVNEMHATSHAKFGNGIVKTGEDEDVRITLDLVNETGSRAVAPFDGMVPADAYIWARYREDARLQEALLTMTQNRFDSRRGYYGVTGDQAVIKNCGIIKDAKIGAHCYIKGANKLKNLTIQSSAEAQTQIGEGVELVNGIVGEGSRIFYGCKAVRFVLGSNSALKYGARLIHSYLGDNSTVSCCELLNNLIFPAHEQHHNNSFLVAALVLGQSNIAAGATIGSNHNSRANDNEIQAGRGFWPGLNTSLKHSSRFASFALIAKGSFPAELDVRLPFSLVSNNVTANRLEIMPAFWWLYNMYALARNAWKFRNRDHRARKEQNIEFDALAPDSIEEILLARELLERWTGIAVTQRDHPSDGQSSAGRSAGEYEHVGRRALSGHPSDVDGLTVYGEDMERSDRDAVILKARDGYHAYGEMLHYYAATTLVGFLESHPEHDYESLCELLRGTRCTQWVNMGGQLVPSELVDELRDRIRSGAITSWGQVHETYNSWWEDYPTCRARHAFAVYCHLHDSERPETSSWMSFLERSVAIQELVRDRVFESRQKDYDNPFRRATYRTDEEMFAALGTIDDNSFVKQVRAETEEYRSRVNKLLNRD